MVERVAPEEEDTIVLETCEIVSIYVESIIHLGRIRFDFALVRLRLRSTHGTAATSPEAHLSRSESSLL